MTVGVTDNAGTETLAGAAGETSTITSTTTEQSADFFAKLQQASNLISSLKSDYRALERKYARELKLATKDQAKKRKNTKVRPPSGFVKPAPISDELAAFLGKDKGTEMARTAVTRDINQYIRLHKLQDKDNGRKINPDLKLASLLKIGKDDILTYFNLQRFMRQHFPKPVVDGTGISAVDGTGISAVENTVSASL